jgi:23S rRNA (cytosine1962-C5)-methyltransferase
LSSSDSLSLPELLGRTLQARQELLHAPFETACRLFNGFYEGWPALVVEVYARTLVLFNYAKPPQIAKQALDQAASFYLEQLPWLQAVVVKARHSPLVEQRNGVLIHGENFAGWVDEAGIRYALDLFLNQDASFYLDTRALRAWLHTNLAGKRVLNAFAYTGSLGVAARAGGASHVTYLDLNRKYHEVIQKSYSLNNFPIELESFCADNFFPFTRSLRRKQSVFDCVILDPPLFSATPAGVVDLQHRYNRLLNKVRPLVDQGGKLVVINNALYLSGANFIQALQELTRDGYLTIDELIPVPEDCSGYPHTRLRRPPVDPAPFNHPTKIVILGVRRK